MNQNKSSIKILIVSPVRNEEKYIKKTIVSLILQEQKPTRWIIVDDGSKDNTYVIAELASQENNWITVCRRKDRGFRDLGKGVVEAIYEGLKLVDINEYDYLGIVDGDISIHRSYINKIIKHFQNDPLLGIASGWIRESKPRPFFPVNAFKLYRRLCFENIGGLSNTLGWDIIDTYKAMQIGWKTKVFWEEELEIVQLRKVGVSKKGKLHGLFRDGQACYLINYHPLYFLFRIIKGTMKYPFFLGGLARLFGYLKLWFSNNPTYGDKSFRRFVRKFQIEILKQKNPLN